MKTLVAILLACAACGDNITPGGPGVVANGPIGYANPTGGKLRLIKGDDNQPSGTLSLQLVVGDQAVTGYSVGFDLALDDTLVTFGTFTPGSALSPGSAPIAAQGVIPTTGPLAHQLVTGQSQKASGAGAVTTNTNLAPGTVVYSFTLSAKSGAAAGTVFDGTTSDFALTSAGMRDLLGNVVVAPADVAIGKLVTLAD